MDITMLYVGVFRYRPETTEEQFVKMLSRRLDWKYPEGITVHGEYWTHNYSTSVIQILEPDDYESVWEISWAWSDGFEISFYPATTAEDGVKTAKKLLKGSGIP